MANAQLAALQVELCEVFSSIQGEGPCVGYSTLFVRFANCDLRCAWCDTPTSWKAPRSARFETARGSRQFQTCANPVSAAQVLEACEALGVPEHRYVSLTGGEPLLQAEAVAAIAATVSTRGPQVHLETHGAAPDALAEVIEHIDVVSMDWKFASDSGWASGEGSFAVLAERSLQTALGATRVYVKAVITPNTQEDEFEEMLERIAACDPATPLILQPVSVAGKLREGCSASRVMQFLTLAEARLKDVRVIPQTHKLYGVL